MSGPEMKSKAAMAFKIEGELTVVDSTTVICLRQAPDAGAGHTLDCSRFDGMGGAMLKAREEVTFTSGWQVLMVSSHAIWPLPVITGLFSERLLAIAGPG